MATCYLCPVLLSDADLLGHLARHDTEAWERWPDGDLVVVDMTLEPSDFEEIDHG